MRVLALESSCDETSAAVIDEQGRLRANVILSQQDHALYGGVVPELASRAHLRTLMPVIDQALAERRLVHDQRTVRDRQRDRPVQRRRRHHVLVSHAKEPASDSLAARLRGW